MSSCISAKSSSGLAPLSGCWLRDAAASGVVSQCAKIPPAVQGPVDDHHTSIEMKGDRHAPFESYHPKAGEKIIPSRAADGELAEPAAIGLDAFQIAKSAVFP